MTKKHERQAPEITAVLLLGAISFQLTSCRRSSAGAGEPAAPEVEVATDEQKDIPVYREWIGTLDGMVNAAIRAQVTGYLLTQDYSEGSFVKKGQLLFQIDARPLQAATDQARGQLAQANGQLAQAHAQYQQSEAQLASAEAMRYNEYRSAQINGSAAPGYSSDQATAVLEDVFKQTMPREMGFDYMGMSYQEQKARQGVPAWAIFGLSLLFVFLVLAALYESWSLPFSVLLSTPV